MHGLMETRRPRAALLPFVSRVWATDGARSHPSSVARERVLPAGQTHLVVRLGSEPLRLYEDEAMDVVGPGVVGGVRSRAYVKDVRRPLPSVGAVLEPGAVAALFGVPATELAGRHTPLDVLWGRDADRLADELAALPDAVARLDRFERVLAARLPSVRGMHPGIARALAEARECGGRASALAEHAGLGPRRFGQLFRDAVGVSPKRWLRLRRFQRSLARARASHHDWADIAFELGYSDQPHFVREFRDFAGLTPSEYRRVGPREPNHVPIEPASTEAPGPAGPISSRRRPPGSRSSGLTTESRRPDHE